MLDQVKISRSKCVYKELYKYLFILQQKIRKTIIKFIEVMHVPVISKKYAQRNFPVQHTSSFECN